MIASGCPFGLEKRAWPTYGSARLTLGYNRRVEDEGIEGLNEMRLEERKKKKKKKKQSECKLQRLT